MARPLRIEYPNAYYHVMCRGNARQDIFLTDGDRDYFLKTLEKSSEIFSVNVIAYCLMDNHFHLVVKTPRANLSAFMRQFNISYVVAFNHFHSRVGHLFQGRYKANLIDADTYLLEVTRYIHLNPVRANNEITTKAQIYRCLKDYKWSSFSSYISPQNRVKFLDCDEVLAYFGQGFKAALSYGQFVLEGTQGDPVNPFNLAKGHGIIGNSDYLELIISRFADQLLDGRERPQISKLKNSLSTQEVIEKFVACCRIPKERLLKKGARYPERPILMELLYQHCSLSQAAIGDIMGGVDYTAVSFARKRLSQKMLINKKLAAKFHRLRTCLFMD